MIEAFESFINMTSRQQNEVITNLGIIPPSRLMGYSRSDWNRQALMDVKSRNLLQSFPEEVRKVKGKN